jgi:transcriptional regulator with XRE-family HTH domain
MTTKKLRTAESALREIVGVMTLGRAIRALRLCDEATQDAYAVRLGISKQHLCDIEKERKTVSAARAAEWARKLGQVEAVFVELAVRSLLREAGLAYDVRLVPTVPGEGRGPKKRAA